MPSIVYGWLLCSLQNIVTRFDRTYWFLIRLFLKNFGILIAKISGSAEREKTHDSKSKQVSKKLKESDRYEKIELRTIRLFLIMIFCKEQSLTKNRLKILYVIVSSSNVNTRILKTHIKKCRQAGIFRCEFLKF